MDKKELKKHITLCAEDFELPKKFKFSLIAKVCNIRGEDTLVATFFNKGNEPIITIFQQKEDWLNYWHNKKKYDKRHIDGVYLETTYVNIVYYKSKGDIYMISDQSSDFFTNDVDVVSGIDKMQIALSSKEIVNRQEEKQQKIIEIMDRCPPLPENLKDRLHLEIFAENRYIFYKRNGNKTYATCTYCGVPYTTTDKMTHGEKEVCPHCFKYSEARAGGRGGALPVYENLLVFTKNELGEVYIQHLYCYQRYLNKRNVYTGFEVKGIYFLGYGEALYINHCPYYNLLGRWQISNNFEEQYCDVLDKDYVFDDEFLKGTVLEHSQISYFKYGFLKYLRAYIYNPNMEYLISGGFKNIAEDIYNEKKSHRGLVDVSYKKPRQMLGLSKISTDKVRDWNLNLKELAGLKFLVKHFGENGATKERLNLLMKIWWDYSFEQRKNTELGIKDNKYLLSLLESKKLTNSPTHIFTDYIKMAEKLGRDTKLDRWRYPKDLLKEHDMVAEVLKGKESEMEKVEYLKRYEELSVFSFSDETYCIRPAKTHQEIINEGVILKHCVKSFDYAKNHKNGKTAIFFMRSILEPDNPLYTVEFDENRFLIKQNHGYGNDEPRNGGVPMAEDVKAWANNWAVNIAPKLKKQAEKDKKQKKIA